MRSEDSKRRTSTTTTTSKISDADEGPLRVLLLVFLRAYKPIHHLSQFCFDSFVNLLLEAVHH